MVQCRLLLLLVSLILAGCAAAPTRVQLLETAVARGCWPDPYDTPVPVTVTTSGPSPTPTVSPTLIIDMLRVTPQATLTPASTTTPFPRCPPEAGATLVPWPTPIPSQPPLPTFAPAPWQQGSTLQTTIQLPGPYGVHLAVHPTENWPAVALWTRLWNDPITGFVAVYNPHSQRWSTTQQVDVGQSSIGDDRWGNIVVTVTGLGEVVAVWGASDKGGTAPSGGIWTSSSTDYGTSWSAPERIEAGSCYWPSDVDSTLDGQVAVLAWCGYPSIATLIRRDAEGQWQPATRVPQALGNMGALRVVGNGPEAQLVALTTSFTPSAPEPSSLTIVRQPLAGGSPILTEVPYQIDPGGGMPYRHHGLRFVRNVNGQAQEGVQFTFATFPGADVYAVTSYNAGVTWSPTERIVYEADEQPNHRNEVVSGYDPRADAFVSVWTCCGKNTGVHSASVRAAASERWETVADPLVDGAVLAERTSAAQAAGLGSLWLAWIEAPDKVQVRSLELNTLIDPTRYPHRHARPQQHSEDNAMMHLFHSRRLCGQVAGLALLLAILACNGSAVLVASTPKWARPSPTPKPYGEAGPVKQTEEYDCVTDPITGERSCKERDIYYEEWEQEYGHMPGPPFPSPTPYGIKGTSYPLGYRVAIGSIFALVDATAGQVQPDGQQLTLVHLQWHNPTGETIPYHVNDLVRVRAITDPSGRIVSSQRWGVTHEALVAAGVSELLTSIPPGDSAASVPILTPQGAPKTVELEFPGLPGAAGVTPTPNPDLAAAPASLVVTWTRTTALSGCDDPGALTPWDEGPGVAWGHDAPIGTPAPSGTSRLIQIALQQVGKPYVWGAKGPEVFDCSGLTEWSYAQIGIRIPRGTAGQWPEMRPIEAGQLQPGDLVFFAIEGGRVDHVGLVADVNGDGRWDLIHAASPQYGVRVDLNLFGSRYYASRITGFRTAR